MRGKFIVFEGPDGSGKTTQLRLLAERLAAEGVSAASEREPTGSAMGALVREILSGRRVCEPQTLALLFSADRSEHVGDMLRLLDEGKHVLCDRYVFSSIAYQGLDLPTEWVAEVNRPNTERLMPDAVVYIDLDERACMERITRGRDAVEEIFETRERIKRVRQNYEYAFDRLPPERLFRIDGARTQEEVACDIYGCVRPLIEEG